MPNVTVYQFIIVPLSIGQSVLVASFQTAANRTGKKSWDGSEVWLLTAVGATFAAFPDWHATVFRGFHLPFALILLVLILCGVCLSTCTRRAGPRSGAGWTSG